MPPKEFPTILYHTAAYLQRRAVQAPALLVSKFSSQGLKRKCFSGASMNNQPFVNNTSAQTRMAGVSGSEHGQIPTKQPLSQEGNQGCQW